MDAGAGAGALAAGAGDRLAAPDGADATLTDFEVCQGDRMLANYIVE